MKNNNKIFGYIVILCIFLCGFAIFEISYTFIKNELVIEYDTDSNMNSNKDKNIDQNMNKNVEHITDSNTNQSVDQSHDSNTNQSQDSNMGKSQDHNKDQNNFQNTNKNTDQNEVEMFYWKDLNQQIIDKITGISYPAYEDNIQISYNELAYVHVLHYNFDDEICEGEIICNKKIADDLIVIFNELYNQKYQIEKIRLVDEYNADDMESMADNNSSAFNYRVISGTDRLSNHSFGLAIDINPLYNPYVFSRNGKKQVQPYNSDEYVDRDATFEHKITHEDLCYRLFTEHGFTWGGDWTNSKDYQHFEKIGEGD